MVYNQVGCADLKTNEQCIDTCIDAYIIEETGPYDNTLGKNWPCS